MKVAWLLLAFLGGVASGSQPLLTGALGKQRGVLEAVLVSSTVTFATLCLLLFAQIAAGRGTGLSTLISPWLVFGVGLAFGTIMLVLVGGGIAPYYYVAGWLGLAILVTLALATPQIGLGAALAAAVTGQMVVGLIWDQVGVLGLPELPITPWKLLGVGLLLAGVWLIKGT